MKKIFILFGISLITASCFSQTTVVLQPNADLGKDARIHNLGTYNSGNTTEFEAMAWTYNGTPGIERSLINFDLSQIPTGSHIISAKLSLFDCEHSLDHHSNLSGSNVSVLQRIISDWDENTITWETQPQTTNSNQVFLDEITSSYFDYLDIDVTALIQDMVNNPLTSFGMMFKLQTESYYRSVVFASSDHTDSSKHPKLEISFYPPTCLIADYPFSGNADDNSGNNHNGTVYGAQLTTDRFGNENAAYYFDGIDDYIDLNEPLLPTDGSDWSLSLWFKQNNLADNELKNIFAQYEISEGRFHTFIYNNELRVFSSNMEHGYAIAQADTNWNHLAFISSGNLINIYLNCMLVAENIAIDNILNTNSLIGDDGSNIINRFFKGKIDDVKIFACALNADELMQLCEYQPECLVADYPFSGNADDNSGNNHNGTVYGAQLTTDRFGNENAAYYFDGIDDYIDLNKPLLPTDGSDWSLSLWFKQNNLADNELKNIFAQYEISEGRFHTFIYNNELRVFSSNMEHGYAIAQADTNWNHLAFISSGNLINIYLNCMLVAENIAIDNILNTNSLIGDDGSNIINRFFKGKIDDVKIFACALNADELMQLCEYQPECLVADYPFSGNADDNSGNNHNGTVYGAQLTTDRFGNENAAYYFDGIDDYIDFNTPLLPTNGSDWSLSLWFKNENPADNELKNIFAQYEISEGRFHTFIYNNELRVFSSSMENDFPIAQVNSNWKNLIFVSSDNLLNIYLNCRIVADSIPIDNILNTNTLIGDDGSNMPNRFFKGKIDDINVFHCALSQEEIWDICSESKSTFTDIFDPELIISPNPSRDVINVNVKVVDANVVNSTSELIFYNLAGSMVLRKRVSNFPTEINISSLPQGIYIIKLVNADFSLESKFIKIKQ
jgi:hypothetical protein